MSVDFKTHILRAADTATAGFNSSDINRDFMSGYCIVANVTDATSTLANCHFNLAASIDGMNYSDIAGSTLTVTTTDNLMWDVAMPFYSYVRVESTMTAGKITCAISGRSI
jgi:hypothetical protein